MELNKQESKAKASDAIAIMGKSGEQIYMPHLHFELWFKRFPVNQSRAVYDILILETKKAQNV